MVQFFYRFFLLFKRKGMVHDLENVFIIHNY